MIRPAVIAALAMFFFVALPAAEVDGAWDRYFPDRPTAPADHAGWEELARSWPNRVKRPPAAPIAMVPSPAATLTAVSPGIDYLRVRRLAGDLDALAGALERPRLIVDLRYIHSELDDALPFGALLARAPLRVTTSALQPFAIEPRHLRPKDQLTLCLINRATSGPIEAVLDALQASGDVLLVGTQSAGDTGRFGAVMQTSPWRVIVDDYRRAGGTSLLDVGVTPGLFVETIPGQEDSAYLAFDAGRPVADLLDAPVQKLRFDEATLLEQFDADHARGGRTRPARRTPPTTSGPPAVTRPAPPDPEAPAADNGRAVADTETPEPAPYDRSLQRAVNTFVAHEIFHAPPPAPAR